MQIVIDISKDIYTRLFDNGIQDNEIAVDDVCEMARAIRLGTPLPKGHGRIIDEDKIPGDGSWDFSDRLDETPTIIEADEEVEE